MRPTLGLLFWANHYKFRLGLSSLIGLSPFLGPAIDPDCVKTELRTKNNPFYALVKPSQG